jgi:hypothetical protein
MLVRGTLVRSVKSDEQRMQRRDGMLSQRREHHGRRDAKLGISQRVSQQE